MRIPTVTTDRLVLRPFREEDAPALHRIYCEKGVLRYFPKTDPRTLNQVQEQVAGQLKHWEKHGYGWWAVEPRSKSEFIGWSGLQHLPDTGETEVAGLLAREYWGQGLAVEGAREGLRYGFENLDLKTIVGIVHPENSASRRVLEKLGMSYSNDAEYFGMKVCRYIIEASSYTGRAQAR